MGEISVIGAVGLDVEEGEVCGELCFFRYCLFFLLKLRQGTTIGESEPEHDTLQVPEDPVWLSTLITSRSSIVPLLLKLAYKGCPQILEQRKNYVDEKEKSTNCVPLAVRRRVRSRVRATAKALLASKEMVLSSGSQDLTTEYRNLQLA